MFLLVLSISNSLASAAENLDNSSKIETCSDSRAFTVFLSDSRSWSSKVVKRLEDNCKINFREKGYPDELVDKEKEEKGYEI